MPKPQTVRIQCAGCSTLIDFDTGQIDEPLCCAQCERPIDVSLYPPLAALRAKRDAERAERGQQERDRRRAEREAEREADRERQRAAADRRATEATSRLMQATEEAERQAEADRKGAAWAETGGYARGIADRTIPKYDALLLTGQIIAIGGYVTIALALIGVVLVVIALANNAPAAIPTVVVWVLGAAVGGIVQVGMAHLLYAVRDAAINSFHLARMAAKAEWRFQMAQAETEAAGALSEGA